MPQYSLNFFFLQRKAQLHSKIYTNNYGILSSNLNIMNIEIDIFQWS